MNLCQTSTKKEEVTLKGEIMADIGAVQSKLSAISEGKTLIEISSLDELKADAKRVNVIDRDTIFDDCFKNLLLIHFSVQDKEVNKLFEPSIGGPLVSLTHKARLGYALGLIDKTDLKDLEQFHNIRNIFAHNTEASFTEHKVIECVKKLSTAKNHEVTTSNSYKLYNRALDKYWVVSWKEIVKQETYRQAMLAEEKKEANSRTKKRETAKSKTKTATKKPKR